MPLLPPFLLSLSLSDLEFTIQTILVVTVLSIILLVKAKLLRHLKDTKTPLTAPPSPNPRVEVLASSVRYLQKGFGEHVH